MFQRLQEIERCFKKYDNRLRNLNLKVRDAVEDRRAHRVISKSKRKRSNSRYKQQSSTSSVEMRESREPGVPRASPRISVKNDSTKQK